MNSGVLVVPSVSNFDEPGTARLHLNYLDINHTNISALLESMAISGESASVPSGEQYAVHDSDLSLDRYTYEEGDETSDMVDFSLEVFPKMCNVAEDLYETPPLQSKIDSVNWGILRLRMQARASPPDRLIALFHLLSPSQVLALAQNTRERFIKLVFSEEVTIWTEQALLKKYHKYFPHTFSIVELPAPEFALYMRDAAAIRASELYMLQMNSAVRKREPIRGICCLAVEAAYLAQRREPRNGLVKWQGVYESLCV